MTDSIDLKIQDYYCRECGNVCALTQWERSGVERRYALHCVKCKINIVRTSEVFKL